jgi:hypothetical protein
MEITAVKSFMKQAPGANVINKLSPEQNKLGWMLLTEWKKKNFLLRL